MEGGKVKKEDNGRRKRLEGRIDWKEEEIGRRKILEGGFNNGRRNS